MSTVNIKIRVTVDPSGRVLVHENEQTLPSDKISIDGYSRDYSGDWAHRPGVTSYFVDVTLPIPPLPGPTARIVNQSFGGEPLRVTIDENGKVDSNG